jgi:hypothetical protein
MHHVRDQIEIDGRISARALDERDEGSLVSTPRALE